MNATASPLLPLMLDNVPPGLARALAQEGVPFRHRARGTAEGRFVLYDSRGGTFPRLRVDQVALDVDRFRVQGKPDPFEQLVDERAASHRWRIDGLVVTEEVGRVDRRAVRRALLDRLRAEIERAGGVWLCVAAFPFPYRSAMNFRLDHDRHVPADFDAVLRALAGNEHATSHYVNGAAYAAHADAVRRLRGLDVGSHGYHHHTYLTEAENRENVGRGIDALRAMGIEPSGFVAPRGRFNHGLLAALEDLGVSYSSEFGLAHDELPFYPRGGSVLQIPIHPVSLGIILEAIPGEGGRWAAAERQAVATATEYYRRIAREKYRAGEPVFLYGHPDGRLGRYPELLRAVFETVDDFSAIWKTTLSEFAAWWRARETARLVVAARGGGYLVTVEQMPKGYDLGVEYWRGRHVARMPLDGQSLQFSPSALAYENRSPGVAVRPVRVDGPEGLRGRLRRWIDWERETPVEEIRPINLRNLAKRTLRRIRP